MKRICTALACTFLALPLIACDYKPPPLSAQEQQAVTELTSNLKPRCVGRYLIDMPGDVSEFGDAKFQGVFIRAKAMTEDVYHAEVAEREAHLRSTQSIDAYPFLYAAGGVGAANARYFIHRGTVRDDPSRRYIEGYKWDRGYRFFLTIKSFDYTQPDQTSDPIVSRMTVKNSSSDSIARVLNLLENLRGRAPDDIPTEPGVCFPGGFLPRPAGKQEHVSVRFRLSEMDDVRFHVLSSPEFFGDTTLLQHSESAEVRWAFGVTKAKNIRRDAVNISGMSGSEWLFEGLKHENGKGVTFSLKLNELATSSRPESPNFSIELTSGGQMIVEGKQVSLPDGSLTTGQALALWDVVTRTIRLRPGAL